MSAGNLNSSNVSQVDEVCTFILTHQHQPQETKQAMNQINDFIMNWKNFTMITEILETTQQENTIFLICECFQRILMNKTVFFANTKNKTTLAERMENFQLTETKEEKVENDELMILNQLFNFFLPFYQKKIKVPGLQLYVLNSIAHLISVVLRNIWKNLDYPNPESYIEKIYQQLGQQEGYDQKNWLYLSKIFIFLIQNISSSQICDGYLAYRRIMNSFQNYGLYPIIKMILDFIRVNRAGLDTYNPELLFNIFQLLHECLSFNFNLSYYEYETDQEFFDSKTVFYSLKIAQLFLDIDVLQTLFELVIKLLEQNNKTYLAVLKGLNRIVSSRQTIFEDKAKKRQFREIILKGITFIIQKIQAPNEELFLDIIDYNLRLVHNFQLKKMQKFPDIFAAWLENLHNFSIYSQLYLKPSILNESVVDILTIWSKMGKYMIDPKIEGVHKEKIKEYIIKIGNSYIEALYSSKNYFKDLDLRKHKQLVKLYKRQFDPLFEIVSFNYQSMLQTIELQHNKLSEQFLAVATSINLKPSDTKEFFDQMAVYFGIISTVLMNPIILDRNALYDLTTEAELKIIARILSQALKVIFLYVQNSQRMSALQTNSYFELSILFFIDNYLTQTLSQIDVKDLTNLSQGIMEHKYYTLVQPLLDGMTFDQIIDIFINKMYLNFQDIQKLPYEYSILILYNMLFKTKHKFPREQFMEVELIKKSINILQNLASSNINTHLLNPQFATQTLRANKLRMKIFELITFLYFDDYYDDFITNLKQVIQKIAETISSPEHKKEQIICFLFSNLGMANRIDVAVIYKAYLKIIFPYLQIIYSETMIQQYKFDDQVMVPMLKLIKQIFCNRGQRMGSGISSTNIYLLFKFFSQFINFYIFELKKFLTPEKLQQIVLDSADFNALIHIIEQIWRIYQTILDNKLLNYSVYELFNDDTLKNYLQLNLDLHFLIFDKIFYIKKIAQLYIENLLMTADNLLETIFGQLDISYALQLMQYSLQFIQKVMGENLDQSLFQTIYDDNIINKGVLAIQAVALFCMEEQIFHDFPSSSQKNVQLFVTNNKFLIEQGLYLMLELVFKYNKSSKVISQVSSCIFAWITIDQEMYKNAVNLFFSKYQSIFKENSELLLKFQLVYKDIELKFDTINVDKFCINVKMIMDEYDTQKNNKSNDLVLEY